MSTDYGIKITLEAQYNKENIKKILDHGAAKGFIYYDHIFGESYDDAPKISSLEAAEKIIDAYKNKIEGGPAVYTYIGNHSSIHLWLTKSEDGYLELDTGCFNSPKKKGNFMDFAYYLRMFLDICEDFPVVEVKTEIN